VVTQLVLTMDGLDVILPRLWMVYLQALDLELLHIVQR